MPKAKLPCHVAVTDLQHDRAAQHLLRRSLGGRAVLDFLQDESHASDQRRGVRVAVGGQLKQRHFGRVENGIHLLKKRIVHRGVVPIRHITHNLH